MYAFYRKKEVLFAVTWILFYVTAVSLVRSSYGNQSLQMVICLGVIAFMMTLFVKRHHLEETYGLDRWPRDSRQYMWFLPMWFIVTGNLWGGIQMNYHGMECVYGVIVMALIGFVEELLFRGFLFKALIREDGVRKAVIISSLTFGIGHIANLLTGQVAFDTVLQVFFAIAVGFLFTMVCLKSGSMFPCIIAHSLIDVFSQFAADRMMLALVYMAVSIVISAVYCARLMKLPDRMVK